MRTLLSPKALDEISVRALTPTIILRQCASAVPRVCRNPLSFIGGKMVQERSDAG
jgi:hypothetical protein